MADADREMSERQGERCSSVLTGTATPGAMHDRVDVDPVDVDRVRRQLKQ